MHEAHEFLEFGLSERAFLVMLSEYEVFSHGGSLSF